MNDCDDCLEIKKLKIEYDGLKMQNECRDIEHEAAQNQLGERITNMEQKFEDFKEEVKENLKSMNVDFKTEIKSIKDEIPEMLENANNKQIARFAKWALITIGGFILVTITKQYAIDLFQAFIKVLTG